MSERALVRPDAAPPMIPPVRVDTTSIGLMELCGALAKSGYFKDSTDPGKALVKILYGQELGGIGPVTSLMGIHIIEGKPSPSANLMAAMVQRSGRYRYRVSERTDEAAEIVFFERTSAGWEEVGRSRWTLADAQRAGLAGKGPWKSYPRAMLFSRALSEGVRVYCPDLFGGAPVYTPEELGADVDAETGAPIRVDTRTGEVIDVSGRVAGAAETHGSYTEATVRGQQPLIETPPADPKAACEALARALGWKAPLGGRYKQLAEGVDLPDNGARWAFIHDQLQQGVDAKHRAWAIWQDICTSEQWDKGDRDLRMSTWGDFAGRKAESTADYLPTEWLALADGLQDFLSRLRTRDAEMAAASTPAAAEAPKADPFTDE